MEPRVNTEFENFFDHDNFADQALKLKIANMDASKFIAYLHEFEKNIQKTRFSTPDRNRALCDLFEVGVEAFVDVSDGGFHVRWEHITNGKSVYILFMMFSNGILISEKAPSNGWDIIMDA